MPTRPAVALVALLTTRVAWATPPSRFFLAGDGTLALEAADGPGETLGYRRSDGSYDPDALARIRRVFRSHDGAEGSVSLRLIEVLAHLQQVTGRRPLVILSGYRSPAYNDGLRARGRKAAAASLHTEGLAADLALPRSLLRPLWLDLRALDCCGVGLYESEGFLHVDVGRPRFWTATTSRVDENLSAGNARLFASTDFDRYAAGERMAVTLHAVTAPPVWIAPEARLVPEAGEPVTVRLDGDACVDVEGSARELHLTVPGRPGRARLQLRTCEPRLERTPPTVDTNPIEVR
jgi:uncharacterized protein YcbK (DUF882 family)